MIDLTPNTDIHPVNNKLYPLGVPKQCVAYNGHIYMMKLPETADEPSRQFLFEYIASHIFNIAGVSAQRTEILNKYNVGYVLLCSDFTDGYPLYSLSQFINTLPKKDQHCESISEFFNMLKTLQGTYDNLPYNIIENRFWSMFVLDAFVNNIQRSFDDWGFVVTESECYLAPVYGLSKAFYAVTYPVDEWSANIYNKSHPTQMINPFEYIQNNISTNTHLLHAVYLIVEHALDDFLDPVHEVAEAFPDFHATLEYIEHLLIVNYNKFVDVLSNNVQANIHQLRRTKVHQYYENHKIDYSQNEEGFVRLCGATPPLILCKNIGINLSDNYERAYVMLCLSDRITPCPADSSKFSAYL